MITTTILIVVIFVNILLGIFVLSQNSKILSNRLFSLLTLFAAIWTFTNFMWVKDLSLFWFNSTFASGSILIAMGLIWILEITEKRLTRKKVILLSVIGILFSVCSYLPKFTTNTYNLTHSDTVFNTSPGWGLFLYMVYYFTVTIIIASKLILSFKKSKSKEEQNQFRLILIGALITLLTTAILSFILPFVFGISVTNFDSLDFLIFLIFIAYSITKHNLFNIKIIAVELVTVSLWIFLLLKLIESQNIKEISINLTALLIVIILGITLIRSLLFEIKQQEKINKLSADLNNAYSELKQLNSLLEKNEDNTKLR